MSVADLKLARGWNSKKSFWNRRHWKSWSAVTSKTLHVLTFQTFSPPRLEGMFKANFSKLVSSLVLRHSCPFSQISLLRNPTLRKVKIFHFPKKLEFFNFEKYLFFKKPFPTLVYHCGILNVCGAFELEIYYLIWFYLEVRWKAQTLAHLTSNLLLRPFGADVALLKWFVSLLQRFLIMNFKILERPGPFKSDEIGTKESN